MGLYLFIGFIIFQRLTELMIARRNERFMKQRGALEFGAKHYPWIVLIHTTFFLSMIVEVQFFERNLSRFWPVLLAFFILTQIIRIWAIQSLGPYWNTKVLVLPGANIVKKGPYRFIRHPNYLVVSLELIIIPLMFNAWMTAAVFTMLNIMILSIRISAEERALSELTYYQKSFHGNRRFIPNLLNKYDNSQSNIEDKG